MEKIKQYLGYIYGLLIAIAAAIIYSLMKRNDNLKTKIGHLEASDDIRQVVMKKEEAEEEANDAEKSYHNARDEFIRKHGDSGTEGGL